MKEKLKFLMFISVSINRTREILCIQKEVRNTLASWEPKEWMRIWPPFIENTGKESSCALYVTLITLWKKSSEHSSPKWLFITHSSDHKERRIWPPFIEKTGKESSCALYVTLITLRKKTHPNIAVQSGYSSHTLLTTRNAEISLVTTIQK